MAVEKPIHINRKELESLWTPAIQELVEPLRLHGFETRIVGGAVRDFLQGVEPRDRDLVTNAPPDAMIYLFQSLDWPILINGIQHGTVRVKASDGLHYEITTLDYWMAVDDHRVSIRQKNSWRDDARARDYTVNALTIDRNGKVWDWVGGLDDLENECIRTAGDFQSMVKERPVTVLRFFKLINHFSNPKWPSDYLDIISVNHAVIDQIDAPRQWMEIAGYLGGKNAKSIFRLLARCGLLERLAIADFSIDGIDRVQEINAASIMGWTMDSAQLDSAADRWQWGPIERSRSAWIAGQKKGNQTGMELIRQGVAVNWVRDLMLLRGESVDTLDRLRTPLISL